MLSCVLLLALPGISAAQELKTRPKPITPVAQPARALANNDSIYLALRNIKVGQEAIPINPFRLKRDAGIFIFRSGTFYLLEPVNGKITGAVFIGDAALSLTPPLEVERKYLKILSKDEFVEQYNTAVFRFTDGTEEEIRKAAAKDGSGVPPSPAGEAADQLKNVQQELKKRLRENLDVRLLQDVLSSQPGGKFVAFIHGKKYSGKLIYDVDPQGVVSYVPDPPPIFRAGPLVHQTFSLAPEEVALIAWDYNHYGIWTAFHFSREYADGTATSNEDNRPFRIEHQKLDTAIEKNATLKGTAETTITALQDGVRVLPFDLFPTLRVDWVAGEDGQPLKFIQEPTEEDSDFAVILSRELKMGESYTITTQYGGKNAVTDEGNGNYYPIARHNWYPSQGFGRYASYEMTFRVPHGMKLAGTGKLLRSVDEGKESVTDWTSEVPLAVAGFNFGNFTRTEAEDVGHRYQIETDANSESPDSVAGLKRNPFMGTMSTVSMMKKATAEAQIALDLYTNYFGEKPYKKLSMTQQTAFNYGQSWPGLVFLPISYFLDSTARHVMGFGNEHGFFKVLGPHEIAHQWWGHMVGWNSYRDAWMSEGFAEMSASLFLQEVYFQHGLDDFHEFWAHQHKLLTDINAEGKRAIDVGPVTLGYRLATAKTGFDVPRDLIYPKGAYILQMVRFMMQDNAAAKDPDTRFKAMMHDFTSTYANRPASTEDFKAMVEKHMTAEMNVGGNRKMDWFFNEYVYGTEYPHYKFEHSFSTDTDGTVILNFKLSQSHVSDGFVMLVPVYVDFGKGRAGRLVRVPMRGNTTFEKHARLMGVKEKPVRALIAYCDDLLGDIENK
jgi:hypothetical protein